MSMLRLGLAPAALLLFSSGAYASVAVVNDPVLLGGGQQTITFDTAGSDTIAEVQANYGVSIHSIVDGAHTFVTGPGYYSGIGSLPSNAFGSSLNGHLADIDPGPSYTGSTLRSFDIDFAAPVSAFGLNVQGAGLVTHSFELFDSAMSSLGLFSFADAGLAAWDGGPNGFAGFVLTGASVKTVRITQAVVGQDFVAFDNLTFVSAPAVPEPASWAMMIAGFGALGTVLRRRYQPQAALA